MIHYILLNDDNTVVINNIFSEKEIVNGIITSNPLKLIKLEPNTFWNPTTQLIESTEQPIILTGSL